MEDIRIPIVKKSRSNFQISINLDVYHQETITLCCYKFTDDYYIHQETSGNVVNVIFEAKDCSKELNEDIVKRFCNELLDQEVRYITNQKFGHIRDLIVEEAFKPVSN